MVVFSSQFFVFLVWYLFVCLLFAFFFFREGRGGPAMECLLISVCIVVCSCVVKKG